MAYLGVDIGGTFTDIVHLDDDGSVVATKVASTPPRFEEGVFAAVAKAAELRNTTPAALLGGCELVLHGTTVATNALVQHRGARVGMITTAGHRDTLPVMRASGKVKGLSLEQVLHASGQYLPAPVVEQHMIREVNERIDVNGEVLVPLDEEQLKSTVTELLEAGAEAIAICFLWSIASAAHEIAGPGDRAEHRPRHLHRRVARSIGAGGRVRAVRGHGHQRVPRARDVELHEPAAGRAGGAGDDRAAADHAGRRWGGARRAGGAAAHPDHRLRARGGGGGERGAGHDAPGRAMSSPPTWAAPASTSGSSPRQPGAVAVDHVNQYEFHLPRTDIRSIGSGGGSIIWLDEDAQVLRVGPESAGAYPGPVCYGRGGTGPPSPTPTWCSATWTRSSSSAASCSWTAPAR